MRLHCRGRRAGYVPAQTRQLEGTINRSISAFWLKQTAFWLSRPWQPGRTFAPSTNPQSLL